MEDFEKQSMFYKAISKLILAAQQIEDFKKIKQLWERTLTCLNFNI